MHGYQIRFPLLFKLIGLAGLIFTAGKLFPSANAHALRGYDPFPEGISGRDPDPNDHRRLSTYGTSGGFGCASLISFSFEPQHLPCGDVSWLLSDMSPEAAASHLNEIIPLRLANESAVYANTCMPLSSDGTNTSCAGLWPAMDECARRSFNAPPYKLMGKYYGADVHPVQKTFLLLQYFHYQNTLTYNTPGEPEPPGVFDICDPDTITAFVGISRNAGRMAVDASNADLQAQIFAKGNLTQSEIARLDGTDADLQDQLFVRGNHTQSEIARLDDTDADLQSQIFVKGNQTKSEIQRLDDADADLQSQVFVRGNHTQSEIARLDDTDADLQTQVFVRGNHTQSEIARLDDTDADLQSQVFVRGNHTQSEIARLDDTDADLQSQVFVRGNQTKADITRLDDTDADLQDQLFVRGNQTQSEISRLDGKDASLRSDISTLASGVAQYQNITDTHFAALHTALDEEQQQRLSEDTAIRTEFAQTLTTLKDELVSQLATALQNSEETGAVLDALFIEFNQKLDLELGTFRNTTNLELVKLTDMDSMLSDRLDEHNTTVSNAVKILQEEDIQIREYFNQALLTLKNDLISQLADVLENSDAAGSILEVLFGQLRDEVQVKIDHLSNNTSTDIGYLNTTTIRLRDSILQNNATVVAEIERLNRADAQQSAHQSLLENKHYQLGNLTYRYIAELNTTILANANYTESQFRVFNALMSTFQNQTAQRFLEVLEMIASDGDQLQDNIDAVEGMLIQGLIDAADDLSAVDLGSKDRDADLDSRITLLGERVTDTASKLHTDMTEGDHIVTTQLSANIAAQNISLNAKIDETEQQLRIAIQNGDDTLAMRLGKEVSGLKEQIANIKPGGENSTTVYLVPEASVTETVTDQVDSIAALQDPFWIHMQYWWNVIDFCIQITTHTYHLLTAGVLIGGLGLVQFIQYRNMEQRANLDRYRTGIAGPIGPNFQIFISELESRVVMGSGTSDTQKKHIKDLEELSHTQNDPLTLFASATELRTFTEKCRTLQQNILINCVLPTDNNRSSLIRKHYNAYKQWQKNAEIRTLIAKTVIPLLQYSRKSGTLHTLMTMER